MLSLILAAAIAPSVAKITLESHVLYDYYQHCYIETKGTHGDLNPTLIMKMIKLNGLMGNTIL